MTSGDVDRTGEGGVMSTEHVQAWLDERGAGLRVIEPKAGTATVDAAAAALGVVPGQIAKTLAVRAGERVLLLVTRGDARLDNARFRAAFGAKPRMLAREEAEELTGQPVGGVSPFGHPEGVEICCDESLRAFDVVYPAGGSPSSAVRTTPDQLAELTGAAWVDVMKPVD
ncbi:YbaK/EbsC family protein [Janibacter alkaliphilus]